MKTILRFVLSLLAVAGAVWLTGGVSVTSNWSLIFFVLALGVVNWAVRPVLTLLTFPITLVTLGLWLLVLNGFLVWLASAFVPGITVKSLWSAIWFALVLSVLSWAIAKIFRPAVDPVQ
jgi:putative membrane protein